MKFQKTASILLAAALTAGMSTNVFAADGWGDTNVDGDSTVRNPIIRYQIPTDLGFAIDAFQKGDATGSQIYSPDYQIINKSDVAIKVEVEPQLVIDADKVNALGDSTKVNVDDATKKDKQVYMEMVAPTPDKIKTDSAGTKDAVQDTSNLAGKIVTAPESTAAVAAAGTDASAATYTLSFKDAQFEDGDYAFEFGGTKTTFELTGKTAPATHDGEAIVAAIGTALGSNKLEIGDKIFTPTQGDPNKYELILTADDSGEHKAPGLNVVSYNVTGIAKGAVEGTVKLDKVAWADTDFTPGKPDDARAKVVLGTEATSMTFALDGAKYVAQSKASGADTALTLFDSIAKATDAPNNITGATTFRFMGKVNPAAEWTAGDVKVKAVFKVSGMNKEMYENAIVDAENKPLDVFTKGANVIGVGASSAAAQGITVKGDNVDENGIITAASNATTTAVTFDVASTGATTVKSITEKGKTSTLTFTNGTMNGTELPVTITTATSSFGSYTSIVTGKTYVVAFEGTADTVEITFA